MRKQLKGCIAGVLSLAMIVTASGLGEVSGSVKAASDEETVFTKELTADDLKDLRFTYNDKSNIGDAHEKELSDGTKLSIKDNGTVRADMSSQTLVDTELGVGINLGNTLEAVQSVENKATITDITKYDTAWSQPVTTRAVIDAMHSYGFNTLRIPVAWSNGDIDDGTYTIKPGLLDRVETVANYALDQGMYVIINDHWDNQWWGQFGARTKAEDGSLVVDQETRDNAWKRYERYWTQIAERFKDYSDHLIFEGANEELGARLNDAICINGPAKGYCKPDNAGKDVITVSGDLKKAELYETVNKINQKFVDIIRGAGGNNESRFLMIPGYDTNMAATADSKYVMPTDPKEQNGVKKLFLSVHTYSPQSFALDNGSGYYTLADQKALAKEFADLKKFSDAGYGTIIGECGFCNPSGVAAGVTQWFYDVYKLAQQYHATPVLWDTGAWFDRTKAVLNYKDMAEFWNTVNQASGDTSMARNTGGTSAPLPGEVVIGKYLDAELWAKKGMHAYLFYQTSNWDYRNAYKPIKNLGNNEHSWDYATSGNQECNAETKVTDVYLTGDGSYTVGIEASMSGNSFKMLGISTDIMQNVYGADISMDIEKVVIDDKEIPTETAVAPIKKDDRGCDFMLANVYNKDGDKHPLGTLNDNEELAPPTKSIYVTFKIKGLAKAIADLKAGTYIDPETDQAIKVDFGGGSDTPAPATSAKNPCKNVTAAKKTVSMKRGKSTTLTFKLTNTTASKKTTDKITVKSSNSKVKAKITKKAAKKVTVKVTVGKKAKKGAKVKITLKVGKKSAKTTVKVK